MYRTTTSATSSCGRRTRLRRGDATVGNPHRAPVYNLELFELFSLKLDRQLCIEQFEAAVSQSAVPSPRLNINMYACIYIYIYIL